MRLSFLLSNCVGACSDLASSFAPYLMSGRVYASHCTLPTSRLCCCLCCCSWSSGASSSAVPLMCDTPGDGAGPSVSVQTDWSFTKPDPVVEPRLGFWKLCHCWLHVLHCLTKLAKWCMLLLVQFVEEACASKAVDRKSVHDVCTVSNYPRQEWMFHWNVSVAVLPGLCLECSGANSVLCAHSTPPCDCELYAPEFLVVMSPFLFATAVISAVRKSPDLVVVWCVMFLHIQ